MAAKIPFVRDMEFTYEEAQQVSPLIRRLVANNPGPFTFRGFEYRGLGPHQGDTPVGGGGLLHGTVRYSMPLFFRELRAFAMFDWGDLESEFGEISTGRFRTAAGGGISVRLQVLGNALPANFYWMKALSSEAGDEEELFSFSLNVAF